MHLQAYRSDNLQAMGVLYGELRAGRPASLSEFGRRNMVRNGAQDGLALNNSPAGVNPFKMGFISSTDTPPTRGGYRGQFHRPPGQRDGGYRNVRITLPTTPAVSPWCG